MCFPCLVPNNYVKSQTVVIVKTNNQPFGYKASRSQKLTNHLHSQLLSIVVGRAAILGILRIQFRRFLAER